MLKTHYYAIDVFTNEYGRKNHMATIKYGKAESGPLAAKLNESLIFRAESFEAELDGMELPVCCGMGWELFPYNGDIIITCQGLYSILWNCFRKTLLWTKQNFESTARWHPMERLWLLW